jgi:hypothetical protein
MFVKTARQKLFFTPTCYIAGATDMIFEAFWCPVALVICLDA